MKVLLTILCLLLLGSYANSQSCEALFTFDGTPLTIHFIDISTHAPNDPIVSWDWDFDDGSGSSQQNPTHTFDDVEEYDVVLQIVTQSGCNSSIEIEIEICDMGVNYNVGQCNANGMVPVSINITDIYDNADEIDVILDGQSVPGSPFQISGGNPVNVTVLVPGNGLSHTINIQSTDIETCGRTITFTTEDCSSDCFLGSLNVSFSGGTTQTVTVNDDFFSPQSIAIDLGDVVHFVWQGSGHSTTSDATSGPDSWNSGVIGGGSTFDVFIDNPGTHRYYCQPHGGPNGVGMSGQILSNCPTGTTLPLSVNFNTTIANPAGYNVLWDNQPVPGSPFDYNGTGPQSVIINISGDGAAHTLIVRDVADPTCDVDMTYNAPDCNQGGGNPVCGISGTVGNFGGCNNNNVTATLMVNVTNGGAGFNVSIDNGPNVFHAYTGNTTTVTITLPGNGGNHTVEITDNVDPNCTATINVTTPNCNLPCNITNLQATAASGNGGPSGITHTVNVQDFQFNPNVVNITVGDLVQWVWTGVIAHTSTSDATSGPNSWSSGLLNNGATFTSPLLTEGTHPYYCVPHGSPGGVGMAGTVFVLPPCNAFGQTNVLVEFNIVSNGTQGFQVLVNGVIAGTFPYVGGSAQSASVLVAGNGQPHTIVVQDILNSSCNSSVTVTTPNCGSGGNPECMISLSPAITGGCNNGLVSVNLNVAAVNNATTYTVTVDGLPAGTFNYNNPSASVSIIGNGQPHTIVITDSGDPACTASASITTTNCSLPCSITIGDLSFGTTLSHAVQVQDFQFSPEEITINLGDTLNFVWTGVIPHTVTSDASSGPNAFNSGLLGQGATWQLVLNATGSFPYYCIPHGAPGGVGMAGVINVTSSCDGSIANGTLVINYAGTSGQGFIVQQDGVPITGSPFTFSTSGTLNIPLAVAGDGAQHTFVVSDAGSASCNAQQVVTVPSCNSSSCTLIITQAAVSACMGNTVTLTVNFTSNQPSSTFNIYKDGLKLNPAPLITDASGNGSYTNMIVGNGVNANITVQFIENTSCSATQSIAIPSCAGPCLISDFVIGQGSASHTVEVKDFTFDPAMIDVLIGDTVHFVWTGVVPHTTTSDQFMGPNSWNSGLLGQGATYNLVIGETGSFPYYCQPHGGPGGIGMSGVINVIDTCQQESWLTNLSFNVSAGSPLGYNVFVDGVKITDTPIQYDDPVGFNNEIIAIPGDGAWHLVTLQDLETGFCAFTQPVHTSICGAGCSVVNLTANTGTNILHTVEVRDFDYYPQNITVGAGEIIRFVWTGEILHTVTSDAVSGPEVFNSGLLGQGATYDLMINTPGVHPYFCLPHGGPGGIGMSGVITVLPACADDNQNVQVKFEVTNGSLFGYNLFVDGVLYGNNPRAYDDRTGFNEVMVNYPADNAQHIITIQDMENNICAASEFFTMGTCNADCQLTGIDYFLGNGRRHEVLVRDFDYSPANLEVESGDTIHFVWTGSIPHTVTSDIATGENAFNSGLLGQGATYDLVLTAEGQHPYYCIPHGAPGGIGMAGNITVVDPCQDGRVFVDFLFFSEGTGPSYDVSNHGNVVLNDHTYQSGGIQVFSLELDAQGQSHMISVSDNGPDDCATTITLDSFDCNDPCFLVRADYDYNINFSTNEVGFSDISRGNIVSWKWNFGDGTSSTLQNPAHTFLEAVLYEVCLTITDENGCTKSFCDKLRLGADVCNAAFTYQQNGLEFVFYNTSDVSEDIVTATWNFGDGGSSIQYDSTTHMFATGIYEICITTTASGCVDTYCEIFDLTDPCLALRSDYQITAQGTNPLHYQFTDQSTGPVGSRLWGFGDGQISTDQHPMHVYTNIGVYTVCLLILDDVGNCTDSDCRTLYVGTTGTEPNEVQLKKIVVVPNPVSSSTPIVNIRGFDVNDIGQQAKVIIHDINGMRINANNLILEQQIDIRLPEIPGVYYLQVITERNTYGAMIALQ